MTDAGNSARRRGLDAIGLLLLATLAMAVVAGGAVLVYLGWVGDTVCVFLAGLYGPSRRSPLG
jgi:hypothetical protein